jgi:hypothetical protein
MVKNLMYGLFAMVLLTFLSCGQFGDKSSEERIIGAWTNEDSKSVWIFGKDGSIKIETAETYDYFEKSLDRYGITEKFISLGDEVYNYSFSADGKTLILLTNTDYVHSYNYWFTKVK